MSKRLVIAGLAGLTAFGAVTASAATLGGINSGAMGAENSIVAACDSDGISIDYTTAYDVSAKEYRVSSVSLGGLAAACKGQSVKVTLANTSAAVAETSGTVSSTSQTLALGTPVSAKAVATAAVVISG